MLRKKVFLYVSFVKSVQFVCAIILAESVNPFKDKYFHGKKQSIGKTEETIFNSRPKKRPANRSICARLTDEVCG